ncbi:tRNA (guanosine(37)-N1)-methyltransferase TrmD [Loktanella salsilacus]|jgi:tRNA (guanine37-N1)-methyltransferase|uniref:tRNA (guanosine(37)-N1)-methyltransferase TrmD n=1 Tax=Loktanella salsilacus TaxID=195913 RepID=UPI001EC7B852|nr:tRNA (guanosine(37)-N1)-methyltransferase TrmD [Loktanella salsilacus]MBU0860465.1 tRNA (guanosine(37)-N1)-methyltransferase TrmD [Alphaproteobacteria bacterium]UTH44162.1 tRNA (guanosine(37)-N1)-methyltransferase TrmD [Loktanella salsilacus]UTH47869.1 tRNA (guanosine(37)-N1)-methyltransferase TrmD [Loktanella salsilacus]
MTDTPPPRAQGRKTIRPTLKPQELMTDTPDLAGVWTAQVLTLLPDAFPGILGESLLGRALKDDVWQLQVTDLRRFGIGKHRNVDETPAGGGAGMVLRADVLEQALREVRSGARGNMPLIYLSPRGRPMTQSLMQKLSQADGVTLLCGRFEGIDERVIEHFDMIEVSLGDFVMTGGEIAAMALIDATVRLIPRVLGNQASTEEESFSDGLLEHPHYTKPADWHGRMIPDVLLSGHHAKITDWRREQAERLTKERRPDLWRAYCAQHGRDPGEDQEL